MNLTIDCREKKIIEEIEKIKNKYPEYESITTEIKQLDLGDFVFSYEENEVLLVERKTISDLIASIKDKRYDEQSLRLSNINIPNHNIVYLLEGPLSKDHSINKTFISSSLSLNFYKGFSVIRTYNAHETALHLCQFYNKLMKAPNKLGYYNLNSGEVPIKEYGSIVKKVKKENLTTDNIDAIMLSQIPNVSYNIASVIINKYDTLSNLIKTLESDKDSLKNLTYSDNTGKSRKVNKTSLENIVNFLIK